MRYIITLFFLSSSLLSFGQEPKWLRYPSISPDGNHIAFTYMGDIYQVSVNGGEARQLTQHIAHDFNPVWSPDSKTIVFASDRNGNFDLYSVSVNGGKSNRLTFHSAHDIPTSFDPKSGKVLFTSARLDNPKSMLFPNNRMVELYSISIEDKGMPEQVLGNAAMDAVYDRQGENIYYHDKKGYENDWRKHHVSAEARDIWKYNLKSGEHTKLTDYVGEDRNPIPYESGYYYLSERSGTFNVWRYNGKSHQQLTMNKKHPVRFLSKSVDDVLCYSFDGEIYLHSNGKQQKVEILINPALKQNEVQNLSISSGMTEFDVSPNGKEVVFVVRGDVFVTSMDYSTTKQITTTPEEERSVSFSPEGDKILYASERSGNWDIYECEKIRKEEKYFFNATLIKENAIISTDLDEFQPVYSPDGKSIAYLEKRVVLKIWDIKSKKSKELLSEKYNYSYKDGDQSFSWSPDSKYLLSGILDGHRWTSEVALVKADGSEGPKNLTNSGYYDFYPKWGMGGQAMIWFSDRDGLKSHGGWGSEYDVYALFFDTKAYDKFKLTKEEFELLETDKADTLVKETKIDWGGLSERKAKLTMHSSNVSDAILSPKGDKLYYLSKFEKGHDLWVTDFYEKTTKLLQKLDHWGGRLEWNKEGTDLFMLSGGTLTKVNIKTNKSSTIGFKAEISLNEANERAYMFNHITRLIENKFYAKDLHGIDWSGYVKDYRKFLPHISNNWEFTEMMSELLGELNASHTGSGYRPYVSNADRTASLAFFPDKDFKGEGIKIQEIIEGSPLQNADGRIKAGVVIEKINGVTIGKNVNYYALLNRLEGERVLLSLKSSGDTWEEIVKPITQGQEAELLYKRWVENNRKYVEEKSNGTLGYVHVRQMNDKAFRDVYDDIFGKSLDKKALVVDTRWNGGGWLHVDLIDLLNGQKYFEFEPRGQYIGTGPHEKWIKPSVVVMNEGNYSNGHMFPYLYKQLNIGKLVGMPVPGTGTAVWWEWQQDKTVYFGIPQVGIRDINGDILENKQLEPDELISQNPIDVLVGVDQQLDKAIEILLK